MGVVWVKDSFVRNGDGGGNGKDGMHLKEISEAVMRATVNTSLCARHTVRPNELKSQFGAEKDLFQGHARR